MSEIDYQQIKEEYLRDLRDAFQGPDTMATLAQAERVFNRIDRELRHGSIHYEALLTPRDKLAMASEIRNLYELEFEQRC